MKKLPKAVENHITRFFSHRQVLLDYIFRPMPYYEQAKRFCRKARQKEEDK